MADEQSNSFTTAHEDEFTDLPLTHDEDDHHQPTSITTTVWGQTSETIDIPEEDNTPHTGTAEDTPQQEQQSITPVVAVGTQAYNPELYTSTAQHSFKDKNAVTIEIIDAGKSREGNSRGYIVYTIQCNDQFVRRRYSEFELLRNALLRLFPTFIIPPIPEKHKITKYAAAPMTKAKDDTKIIDHRRRMLAVFLNRCLDIDSVRESSVFQDFLDPNSNWSEVLASPPLSDIPKHILRADPLDPAHSSAAHSYLPLPSTSNIYVKETEEDKKFNLVESNAREYENVITDGIQKTNKRLVKHFSEMGSEFNEAGAVFNGFCLQENSTLAPTLEKFGQVHDNCYLSSETAVKNFNYEFTEPLGESAQFATVVKEVIKFRQQKLLQLDITARSLKHKLNYLKLLERAEAEAKRIEDAMSAGEAKTGQINFDRKVAREQEQQKLQADLNAAAAVDAETSLEPKKSSVFKSIPGISTFSNLIKMEQADPDAQRHGNLQKTKDEISQLKLTYLAAERDLKRVTESVNGELVRFHESKNEDLKNMMRAYTSTILDWSRKNLEFWEEAKAQMEQS